MYIKISSDNKGDNLYNFSSNRSENSLMNSEKD